MERRSKTKAPVKDKFDIFDPRNAGPKSGATDEMKAMAKYISENPGDNISMQGALAKIRKMSPRELRNLKRATGFSTGGGIKAGYKYGGKVKKGYNYGGCVMAGRGGSFKGSN